MELLGGEDDLEVVGAVAGGEEAIEAARTLRPDVVLMDLEMDGTDGVQATQRIKDADPHPQVVVLTSFSDQSRILAALDAGARGYLLKDATPDELVEGIQSAAKGDAPLAQPAINAIVAARAGEGGLPELSSASATCSCCSPTASPTRPSRGGWTSPRRRSRPTSRARSGASARPTVSRQRCGPSRTA